MNRLFSNILLAVTMLLLLASCASTSNVRYFKKDTEVFIQNYRDIYPVPGADASSLITFPDTPYAKDKNYV